MISPEYIAGFVDGEGCFNIAQTRGRFFPRLLIANTDRSILEVIKNQYGGDISQRPMGPSNWKDWCCIRLAGKSFKKIIQDIYPHLILKRAQAEPIDIQSFFNKGGEKDPPPDAA